MAHWGLSRQEQTTAAAATTTTTTTTTTNNIIVTFLFLCYIKGVRCSGAMATPGP